MELKTAIGRELEMLEKAFEGALSLLESRIADAKTPGRSKDHATHGMLAAVHELTILAGKMDAYRVVREDPRL